MIVFIATYPTPSEEKDGMFQRIASIDSLVSDLPRVYLDISFRRFWSKDTQHFDNATVLKLNGFWHIFTIFSWLRKAHVVYIHSVYNSIKALPAYWLGQPITDLHGAVPEELAYQGKPWFAFFFGLVERIVLLRNSPTVHVTTAMRRHFQQKYHRQSNADRTIAILPRLSDVRGQRDNVLMSKRDDLTVVYAGGIQAWQNVPMMLDAAAALPKMRYIFLTGERWAMEQQAKSAHVINYTCNSVPPNQVPDHYLTSTYGFILRESILLNQVACPTKLVEYLYWGVIPIVLTPNIGDFSELGFMFVSLEDFCSGRLPDEDEAVQIRVTNRQVVESLFKACENELSTLRDTLRRS